ncbi:hypothetical protein TNCV_4316471 [Trichonephila clavipes]|nr:hypothetical protein TNCV_4316471 [Trichonephila clavipes]
MAAFAVENTFCVLELAKCHGSHFFESVNSLWLMPQLKDCIDNFILQLVAALPHCSANEGDYLDEHLLHHWIGRVAHYNIPTTQWLSRIPANIFISSCGGT